MVGYKVEMGFSGVGSLGKSAIAIQRAPLRAANSLVKFGKNSTTTAFKSSKGTKTGGAVSTVADGATTGGRNTLQSKLHWANKRIKENPFEVISLLTLPLFFIPFGGGGGSGGEDGGGTTTQQMMSGICSCCMILVLFMFCMMMVFMSAS
jgi:hypothetical protein